MQELPTNEELESLQMFANKYGRTWKRKLVTAWETGRDTNEDGSYLLRRVRNRFGGHWLFSKHNTVRPLSPA